MNLVSQCDPCTLIAIVSPGTVRPGQGGISSMWLIKASLKNPYMVATLVFVMLVLGLLSMLNIPLQVQPKLLRALQEQEFERLGGTRTVRVDVRLVAATNRDLAQMVADRSFRNDLYYRLNVFPVVLPPLRERRDDIPLLARHFIQRFARRMGRRIESIPAAILDALVRYPWPGNVREMQNILERAVILSPGPSLQIPLGDLQPPATPVPLPTAEPVTLADAEREHILGVLRETDWVVGGPQGAAARLGVKRSNLQWKMKKLGISRPR
jgi:formate hydrogenlyase transcriptional activator